MDKQSNKSGNNSPLREGCEGAILSIHKDDAAVFGHTPVINVISATRLLGSLCFPKEKTNLTENQPGGWAWLSVTGTGVTQTLVDAHISLQLACPSSKVRRSLFLCLSAPTQMETPSELIN